MSPAELDLPVLLTPDHIRRREFVTTRRGYDPEQVRDYLEQVAQQVAAMEAMLREARLEAESALRAQASPRADPYEQLARRVGDVIRSADQEAARLKRDAAQEAARTTAEARTEATRIRGEAETEAERARADAESMLRGAREQADKAVAGLSTRRDELVGMLATMQERLLGVARELEDTIERREASGPQEIRVYEGDEEERPAPVADTWAGWADTTIKEPQPESEALFSSPETVDLTLPEIPPLDLDWDSEDD
jgi:DivIVA domain-containing protein